MLESALNAKVPMSFQICQRSRMPQACSTNGNVTTVDIADYFSLNIHRKMLRKSRKIKNKTNRFVCSYSFFFLHLRTMILLITTRPAINPIMMRINVPGNALTPEETTADSAIFPALSSAVILNS